MAPPKTNFDADFGWKVDKAILANLSCESMKRLLVNGRSISSRRCCISLVQQKSSSSFGVCCRAMSNVKHQAKKRVLVFLGDCERLMEASHDTGISLAKRRSALFEGLFVVSG